MGRELKAAALAFAGLLKSSCNDDRDLLKAKYTENNGNVEFVKKNGETVTLNELIGDGERIRKGYEYFIGLLPEDNDQNLGGNNPQRRTFGAGSDDDAVVDDTDVTKNISGDFSDLMGHAIYTTSELSLNDEQTIKVCVGTKKFNPKTDKAAARDHLIQCLQQTLDDLKGRSPFVSGKPSAMLVKKILRLSKLIKDFERTKNTRGIFKKKGADDFSPGKLFEKAKSAGVRFVAEEFEARVAYHSYSDIDRAVLVGQILSLVHKHRSEKDVTDCVIETANDMSTRQLEDYKTEVADRFNRKKLERALKLPVEVVKMQSGKSYVETDRVVKELDRIASSMSPDGPATTCEYFKDSIYNRYYQKAIKNDVSALKKAISKKKGDTIEIEKLDSEAYKRDLEIELSADVQEDTDNQTYNDKGKSYNAPYGYSETNDNVDDNSEPAANSDADLLMDPFARAAYDGLDDEDKTDTMARYLSEPSDFSEG